MFGGPKWRHGPPRFDLSFDFGCFGAMPKIMSFGRPPDGPENQKMEPWSAKGSQKPSRPEPGGRTGRQGGPGTRVKGLKDEGRADDHTRQRAEGPAN